MREVNRQGLERARAQTAAGDDVVARHLTDGDDAAEHAAYAVALNGGGLARALVGLARAELHLEQQVSHGLLRGR